MLIDGEWKRVEFTMSPEYPNGDTVGDFGKGNEIYTMTLKTPVKCMGIRLAGIAGGTGGWIGVSELTVGISDAMS